MPKVDFWVSYNTGSDYKISDNAGSDDTAMVNLDAVISLLQIGNFMKQDLNKYIAFLL